MSDTQQKTLAFAWLRKILPDARQFDELGQLFDDGGNSGPEDKVDGANLRILGLAVLLHDLEEEIAKDSDDISKTTLGIPVLNKLQALRAAWRLGYGAGKTERMEPHA